MNKKMFYMKVLKIWEMNVWRLKNKIRKSKESIVGKWNFIKNKLIKLGKWMKNKQFQNLIHNVKYSKTGWIVWNKEMNKALSKYLIWLTIVNIIHEL